MRFCLISAFALLAWSCDDPPEPTGTPRVEACETPCSGGLICFDGECVVPGDAQVVIDVRDAATAMLDQGVANDDSDARVEAPDNTCIVVAEYQGAGGVGKIRVSLQGGCEDVAVGGLVAWDPVTHYERLPDGWLDRGDAQLNRPQPRQVVVLDDDGVADLPRYLAAFLPVANAGCDPDTNCDWIHESVQVQAGSGVIDCIAPADHLRGFLAGEHNLDLNNSTFDEIDGTTRERCPDR